MLINLIGHEFKISTDIPCHILECAVYAESIKADAIMKAKTSIIEFMKTALAECDMEPGLIFFDENSIEFMARERLVEGELVSNGVGDTIRHAYIRQTVTAVLTEDSVAIRPFQTQTIS